jgi:hypothetical protein
MPLDRYCVFGSVVGRSHGSSLTGSSGNDGSQWRYRADTIPESMNINLVLAIVP